MLRPVLGKITDHGGVLENRRRGGRSIADNSVDGGVQQNQNGFGE